MFKLVRVGACVYVNVGACGGVCVYVRLCVCVCVVACAYMYADAWGRMRICMLLRVWGMWVYVRWCVWESVRIGV